MIGKQNASFKQSESMQNTATRIIASATTLFAQKGYAATSTKAICQSAGANIAAVHYHFKSKRGLYRQIISHFGSQSLARITQMLRPPLTEDEFRVRLEMFLESGIEQVIEQHEVAHIILRDIELPDGLCREVFRKSFLQARLRLEDFLKAAKKNGILRPSLDADMAAHFISTQILSQHYSNKGVSGLLKLGDLSDPAYRKRWMRETVNLLLNGVLRNR